jgi:FkbM family methyltransferase
MWLEAQQGLRHYGDSYMRQSVLAFFNMLLSLLDRQLTRRSYFQSLIQELATQKSTAERLRGQVSVFARQIHNAASQGNHDDFKGFVQFLAQHHDKSHSQWSQDMFIMHATSSKRGGTYLEIGGADGINGSNTLALRDHLGWTGVLVEPDPSQFARLRRNRPTDTLVNAAVSPRGGRGSAVLRQVGGLSCLEEFKPDDMHAAERQSAEKFVTVETVDLTELINTLGHIDYFSLDVEGAEYDILSSIRWNEIKPPFALTIEHNHRDDVKKRLRALLSDYGYLERFADCDWMTQGDLWFTHKGN